MTLKPLQSLSVWVTAAGLAVLVPLFIFGRSNGAAVPRETEAAPQLVVVELFTSEGCSSCPPADALLKEISEKQPVPGAQVVALEEHVDYWNHLGWRDPYSTVEFSQRQSDYAHVFGTDGVYTPQMIVDGQTELVGSRGAAAREAIQKAANRPKAEITLVGGMNSSSDKPTISVQIKNPGDTSLHGETELWIAVTEKGLQTEVKAGENSGETLKHAAVVRSLRKIENLRDLSGYDREVQIATSPGWKKGNLVVVVFLAEKNSRKIVGAAAAPLASLSASK
jgi:hypothetical protein